MLPTFNSILAAIKVTGAPSSTKKDSFLLSGFLEFFFLNYWSSDSYQDILEIPCGRNQGMTPPWPASRGNSKKMTLCASIYKNNPKDKKTGPKLKFWWQLPIQHSYLFNELQTPLCLSCNFPLPLQRHPALKPAGCLATCGLTATNKQPCCLQQATEWNKKGIHSCGRSAVAASACWHCRKPSAAIRGIPATSLHLLTWVPALPTPCSLQKARSSSPPQH